MMARLEVTVDEEFAEKVSLNDSPNVDEIDSSGEDDFRNKEES